MLKHFTEEIIQSSECDCGTILNANAISHVVELLIESRNLNKDYVDELMDENSTDVGYALKSADFIYVLKPYIIGDNLKHDDIINKPEKDYTMIELMYGDFHSECGDR